MPILCDQELTIIAGHTRWKAAEQLGMARVPVIVLPLTGAQRRAFSVADNKTAEIAEWDIPALSDVLQELQTEDLDLTALGFSDKELRRLLSRGNADEDAVPEFEGEAGTQPGDLWTLGDHRLLCGDSHSAEAMGVLADGMQVDHVFGGPPYFNQREYAQWEKYDDYLEDMQRVIENCSRLLKDGAVLVWNIANDSVAHRDLASHHSRLLEESGLVYLDTMAWVKSGGNFGVPRSRHIRTHRCYYPAFQWEPLLVFQKPGPMPRMAPDDAAYMFSHQTDVWQIRAVTHQVARYGHPAVCPVEVPYRCMLAYTGGEATILEPFGGSGTTLIAAEKAGRTAFLMERMPRYCDVIVRRWEVFTGGKAKRVAAALPQAHAGMVGT